MKHILFLLALLSLYSCDGIRGELFVHEDMKVIHSTMFGNNRVKNISKGSYYARIRTSSGGKIKVILGDGYRFKIKVPGGIDLSRTTEVNLSASEIGQNYDITGHINRDDTDGPKRRGFDSCTYTDRDYVCDGNGNCRWVNVTRHGQQRVEYFMRTTELEGSMNFLKPDTNTVVADYVGSDTSTYRVYTYKGVCR